ncbi:MAG: o-succinylbenzoate synthase [Betaproteobacteria bacterium]|nr:o-succinylbenzoate synthase [Betaproteobacteria bacterium]
MRVAAVRLRPFRLPLVRPWHSAAGTLTERQGWIMRLYTDDGRSGWGECAPLPEAGTESAEQAQNRLEPWIGSLKWRDVGETLDFIAGRGFDCPAARCALETALCDLASQQAELPLARWLDPAATRSVAVAAPPGAEEAAPAGFTVLKLKVGLRSPGEEARRVADLAARLAAGVRLRLDANGAWNEQQAAEFIAAVADLPVECLEEPLAGAEPAALARLQAAAPFPLAVDESLVRIGVERLLAAPPVRRLVLKLAAVGGPLAGYRLACRARDAGLQCVVTTALDSACGRLAALHLACAVAAPGDALAHGLATGAWMAADTGEAPQAQAGRMDRGDAPGLGFRES